MADSYFDDVPDAPKEEGGYFDDVPDAVTPEDTATYQGPGKRALEGFERGYHSITGNAVKEIAPDLSKQYPTAARIAQGFIDWSPLGLADRALATVPAAANAAAGWAAGVAERNPNAAYPMPRYEVPFPRWAGGPMNIGGLNPAEANRAQRDLEAGGVAILTEPGIGLAGQAAHVRANSELARRAQGLPEPPPPISPEEAAEFHRREQASRPPPPPPKEPPPSQEPPLRPGERGPEWRAQQDEFLRWREQYDAGQTTNEFWEPPTGKEQAGFSEIRPELSDTEGTIVWGTYRNGVKDGIFATRDAAADYLKQQGWAEPKPPRGGPEAEPGPQPGAQAGPEPGPEPGPRPGAQEPPPQAERWTPPPGSTMGPAEVRFENGMYNVYFGDALDNSFATRGDAASYLNSFDYQPAPQAGPKPGADTGPGAAETGPRPGAEPGPQPGPQPEPEAPPRPPPPPPPEPPPQAPPAQEAFTTPRAAPRPPPRPAPPAEAPPPRAPPPETVRPAEPPPQPAPEQVRPAEPPRAAEEPTVARPEPAPEPPRAPPETSYFDDVPPAPKEEAAKPAEPPPQEAAPPPAAEKPAAPPPEQPIPREAEVSKREADMLREAQARPEPPPEPPRQPIPHEQYSVRDMLDAKERSELGMRVTRRRTPEQTELADLLARAETRSLELSKLINDAGLKVREVNSFSARDLPEVRKAKEQLSSLGGSVSRLLAGLKPRKGRDAAVRLQGDIQQLREVLGETPEAKPSFAEAMQDWERPAEAPKAPPSRPPLKEKRQSLLQFIAQNRGISSSDPMIADLRSVLGNKNTFIPGYGALVRVGGKTLDQMLEAAVEARYIEDPGFWQQNVPRTSTIRDLLDAIAEERGGTKRYPRGEEEAPRPQAENAKAVERNVKQILRELEEAELTKADIDMESVQDAARAALDSNAGLVDLYEQAVMARADRDAQQARAGGEGERAAGSREQAARPRDEEAAPLEGEAGEGAGKIREARRAGEIDTPVIRLGEGPNKFGPTDLYSGSEVSAADVEHFQLKHYQKTGKLVKPLRSIPLRQAIKELNLHALQDVTAGIARVFGKRLADVVGDVPVHYITKDQVHDYFKLKPNVKGEVGGYTSMPIGRGADTKVFIAININSALDTRERAHMVLHEGTHAAALGAIQNNPLFKGAIRSIMEEARPYFPEGFTYALVNEHEFLSESISSRPVQRVLQKIKAPPEMQSLPGPAEKKGRFRTLWDGMVTSIRKATGLGPKFESLLDSILKVGEYITRAPEHPSNNVGMANPIVDTATVPAKRDQGPGFDFTAPKPEPPEPKVDSRPEMKTEKGVEGKPQGVIPGAERDVSGMLQRKAEAPLKGKVAQKSTDFGLFGDESKQADMFSGKKATEKPPPDDDIIAPALRDAENEIIADQLDFNNRPKWASVSRGVGGGWVNPTEFRVKVQDKFLRIRYLKDQWMKDNPGLPFPENWDVYVREGLYYGKTGLRMREFDKHRFDPLLKDMRKRNVSREELDEYLYAKHVPERNRELRKINPGVANPSGMSEAEASTILQRLQPRLADFQALETKVRQIVSDTMDGWVRDGLITPESASSMEKKYSWYVPLRGHDSVVEGISHGKPYSVRGAETKMAMGRRSKADSPLQYVISQAQQGIIRGERNRVGQTAYEFFNNNPQPDVWKVDQAPRKRVIDDKTGLVKDIADPTWLLRNDPNVFHLKIEGVPHRIRFEGEYGAKIARALNSVGTTNMPGALQLISKVTRTMARLSTTWNPEFMTTNFLRDVGEAFINLGGENKKGFKRDFGKGLIPAIGGVLQAARGKTGGKWAQLYRDYEKAGGKIDFFGMDTPEEIGREVEKRLRRLKASALSRGIRGAGRGLLDAVDIANTAIENGTRLAAFAAARKHGMSPQASASLARGLTVDFNKKGELGSIISSGYMFAGAGIQGVTRMGQAVRHKKVRRALAALTTLAGILTLYNLSTSEKDRDGKSKYSKIASWERDNNLIFMDPDGKGEYTKFPLPINYAFLKVIVDHMTMAMMGEETWGEASKASLWALLGAFDPLGHDKGWTHIVPTALKPAAQIGISNRDAFDRPINPDRQFYNKHRPDSSTYNRSASPWAVEISKGLNELTGGTKDKPGWLDIGPGTLDAAARAATGGMGGFFLNAYDSASRLYQGRETLTEKTPFLRRFRGHVDEFRAESNIYFKELDAVQAAKQQKQLATPEFLSVDAFNVSEKGRKDIVKQIDDIKANPNLSEAKKDTQVKQLQKQQTDLMFNARKILERSRARIEKRKPTFQDGGYVGGDYEEEPSTEIQAQPKPQQQPQRQVQMPTVPAPRPPAPSRGVEEGQYDSTSRDTASVWRAPSTGGYYGVAPNAKLNAKGQRMGEWKFSDQEVAKPEEMPWIRRVPRQDVYMPPAQPNYRALQKDYRNSQKYPVYAEGGLVGKPGDIGDAAGLFSNVRTIDAIERMHQGRKQAQGIDQPEPPKGERQQTTLFPKGGLGR